MKESIDIYSRVGLDCPTFYPNFAAGKSCPEVSKASCRNCRNFSIRKKQCSIGMFDKVIDGLFDADHSKFQG